ncbi:hypothetical protein BJI69_14200 [Luteibacter rhizovicinus DSM 16549]|uniref:Uncharacterized protein n=1 Tax=Luteibacter rhizovicinus DSM 16549 TaxID=1440763 RepID=A0A0G9HLA1_9GAMM|nr:hypothetical protein [Luteibacter rhizovicinus]APG04929.1 hypothetical protein BJI69_14200 [Luteibacter rhizovicinus DSM 16549]KLD68467.1 hypothetical protein Y883_01960 [Luteibacter rhizovicinus DSM 16549]KLD76765.1 hypothetical protein Y886_19625 [Xanthomonas hyacinthi DSM 19077]
MDNLLVNSNHQALADRTGALVKVVNDLIADIESDISAPSDAAFHAKDAFKALASAHNALIDSARERAAAHYLGMARDAQQAAA